jgi:hypothetical protein
MVDFPPTTLVTKRTKKRRFAWVLPLAPPTLTEVLG